jgi:predicted membrane metal-binding protein
MFLPIRLTFLFFLIFFITACNLVFVTDKALVEKAIALQINLSQEQITQQFRQKSQPPLKINRVVITDVESLKLQNLPTFRVMGTYDFTLEYPQRQILHKQNPYQVYLQQQKEGKTWRLLRPQKKLGDNETQWFSYLIE